jgi:NADH:ubiquinone oxidoreductase subunit 3 (subunit A)
MNLEYFFSFCFVLLSFGLAFILFLVLYLLIFRQVDFEKVSAYECGFNPFEDAYGRFDVRFYLVAILFLIFDLEVAFIFPWSSNVGGTQLFGFLVFCLFVGILTIGFFYEWKRGALDWQ